MKYCPNPQCPYALRHHEGQEYRDHVEVCADCGAALVLERPVWPRPAPKPLPSWVYPRLALTLLAPLLVLGVRWLPLPRVDRGVLASRLGVSPTDLPVFLLGLWPIFSAFIVVELVALAVPRWRPLRHGGPGGRARLLTASLRLGVGFAALQALTRAVLLERWGLFEGDPRVSRLIVTLSVVTGTCVYVVFAQMLDRFALGGGFSVMALALTLPALVWFVQEWLPAVNPPGRTVAVAGLLAAGALTFLLLRKRPLGTPGKLRSVRLPACGIVPLSTPPTAAATLWALAYPLREFGLWPNVLPTRVLEGETRLVFPLALTGALAVALGFLFNRPRRVAALEAGEGTGVPAPAQLKHAREEVIGATAWSAAYVLGLALLGWFVAHTLALHDLLHRRPRGDFIFMVMTSVVMIVAVGLDVVVEAQALRRHGELVPVWPEHRLYAVDSALAVLERAGIPCFARSVHHRALWHFFAPYIPIQILVPPPRAEEASRLLHEHFEVGSNWESAGEAAAPGPNSVTFTTGC
jgi:hypothetical protein